MTTKLKWRLSALPETHEVAHLVKEGILTKEEAREILFSLETDEDRDKKSLQEEIKFLRELVQKLSNNQTSKIVETIRYVEKPYTKFEWYQPYYVYAYSTGNSGLTSSTGYGTTNAIYTSTGGTTTGTYTLNASGAAVGSLASQATSGSASTQPDFTAIKTF